MMHTRIKKKGFFLSEDCKILPDLQSGILQLAKNVQYVKHNEAKMDFSYITALLCDGVYNPFSVIGNETHSEQYTFFP